MTITNPQAHKPLARRRRCLPDVRRQHPFFREQESGFSYLFSVPFGKPDMIFCALPVELRVEIFSRVCGTFCPVGRLDKGPVLLLRVCRSWKEFVLQTPHFWTSFSLDFRPLPNSKIAKRLIEILEEWLARSHPLPLQFEVHSVLDVSCAALIQSLLRSAARWRDVVLRAPSTSLRPFWQALPNSFPVLRTLVVETFGFAPFHVGDLGVNWSQLTRLDLFIVSIPTLDECLDVLKQSVNLRQCSLNAVCIFTPWTTKERIPLPLLQELDIKLYGGENSRIFTAELEHRFLAFLRTLKIDGLKSLSLVWNLTQPPLGSHYWRDATDLVLFLRSLGTHLESLHLGSLPSTLNQLIQCLEAVPVLRHLGISLPLALRENDLITDEFFAAIRLRTGLPTLLPYLQSIHLSCHGESFTNPALFNFIASRWRFNLPISDTRSLENLQLFSTRAHTEYHYSHFRDLREGRLDVAARLKSEFAMLPAISSFLNTDLPCFTNKDFPASVRPSLIFM